ncbi:hypothetical protein ACWER6_14200 [Streptomyces sp. NPDC004009]
MTLIRPTAGADGAAHRTGAGRAVALLVLVAVAAPIPLLGPSAALHGTGSREQARDHDDRARRDHLGPPTTLVINTPSRW